MVHQLIKGTINGNHRGTRSKQDFLPKNLKNYLSGWCRSGGLLLLCSPALPCCCPPRTWPRSPLDGNESRLAHAGPPGVRASRPPSLARIPASQPVPPKPHPLRTCSYKPASDTNQTSKTASVATKRAPARRVARLLACGPLDEWLRKHFISMISLY